MKYAERDAPRTILLLPGDDGLWDVPQSEATDPLWTIVRRFGRADTKGAQKVTGTTTLHTPAAGSSVRLKWIHLATPSSTSETVVTVRLGAVDQYIVPLPSPGLFMRTSIREGATDEALSVVLSTGADVYVNYELEEFVA